MSKIICDVCGTSYQETATQCPICGCVRSGEAVTVSGDTNDAQVSPVITYTYVKGGRFSKANVKKRNAGMSVYTADTPQKPDRSKKADAKPKKKMQNTDKVLTAVVVVLLIAIAAVAIYIACRFLGISLPGKDPKPAETNTPGTTQSSQNTLPDDTTETTLPEVACEGLELTDEVVELTSEGESFDLEVIITPEGCTDALEFLSGDNSIAIVDDAGQIEAVGPGQTVIHITCGEHKATCRVVCTFQTETTSPTTGDETTAPTTPDVTYSMDTFKLNREDFTIGTTHAPWTLYDGDISVDVIEWSSDDSNIATFVDGVVTAISPGVTTVYATYNGVTIECIVRVY